MIINKDSSPYEGKHDYLNGKFCFGRITSVDAVNRTCRVKTYGLPLVTDDQDLPRVRFVHLAWHPDGDEDVFIPRVGSYGIVVFINSEPFILGYTNLFNASNGGSVQNHPDLLPGDKSITTVGGNRFTMRSGGIVEILSTNGCRTYYIPSTETINSVCKNFELEPAGGIVHWNLDPDTSDTELSATIWDNLATPTNAMEIHAGATESGAMFEMTVGPINTDTMSVSDTPTAQLSIQPDGATLLNIGNGKVTINITPDGKININSASDVSATVGGNVNIKSSGNATLDAGGDVNIKSGGNTNVTASGNAVVKATKITLNGEMSGITTMNSHQGVVDFITGVPVNPSLTVFGDI